MARLMLHRWFMKHAQAREHIDRAAPGDVGMLLVKDHASLKKLFAELVGAFRAGDRDRCAALWNAFDSKLEAHMALEEQLILPEFAKVDPAEATALGREHVAIRAALCELGIGVDLHCTNVELVERFIHVLEDHARREEALLYHWGRANLTQSVQATIRSRLNAAVHKLLATK